MVSCKKRQKEIHSGEEKYRCIHRDSSEFMQLNPDCDSCPLVRKERIQIQIAKPLKKEKCTFKYKKADKRNYCSLTNLEVTNETCDKCNKETREQEAKLGTKLKNYFGAIRKWVAKGKPVRSANEIEKLFEEHCSKCKRYDSKKKVCKNCGCNINTGSVPLANKLAMKTEHCPLGRF